MNRPESSGRALILLTLCLSACALQGCAQADIDRSVDSVNKSIKGVGSAFDGGPKADATRDSSREPDAGHGSAVSFKRRVPGDVDIVRMPVEDGAMQLRMGFDFAPTATVDNAMPYHWSASCDLFYLLMHKLPNWAPPPDWLSKFSMETACSLNEGGQAFRRSSFDDPIRRRRPYQLNNTIDLAAAIKEWQPVYARRRAEIDQFQGDRYFFVGTGAVTVQPFDAADRTFRIAVDLGTGYAWGKPIVLVGPQLSRQRYVVKLTTDQQLAGNIERARLSAGAIRSSHTKVVFKLNGVKEYADRIDLDITLEKMLMRVDLRDEKTVLLVDLVS